MNEDRKPLPAASESLHGKPLRGEPGPPPLARRWWHEIPMWLFYVPIGLAVVLLSLRHLSPLAALRANSGLENGGLFPKSKQDFFAHFPDGSPLLPVSLKLESALGETDIEAVFAEFSARACAAGDRFVVKPDEGIQGQDVHFFNSLEALLTFWRSNEREEGDWLLQEYIGGMEAAVFYNRMERDKPGRIISMTRKWGFEVEPDGEATIAQLIDRAEADSETKKRVKRTNRLRIDQVPPDGQSLDLMPVRNHHLGATFQDISSWITPELEAAICNELDRINGYQYGRLDIRAPDFQSLLAGKGIKVLEANALYSEPVHAYDPKYGLFDAYHIFIGHWYRAIRTGLNNQRKA